MLSLPSLCLCRMCAYLPIYQSIYLPVFVCARARICHSQSAYASLAINLFMRGVSLAIMQPGRPRIVPEGSTARGTSSEARAPAPSRPATPPRCSAHGHPPAKGVACRISPSLTLAKSETIRERELVGALLAIREVVPSIPPQPQLLQLQQQQRQQQEEAATATTTAATAAASNGNSHNRMPPTLKRRRTRRRSLSW